MTLSPSRRFSLVWFGQLISLCGSNATRIALGIWVYQQTGSTTWFSALLVASALPAVLVSPFAGALIDRWDKQRAMIFAEAIGAAAPMAIALWPPPHPGALQLVAAAVLLSSAATAFQEPALAALTARLAPPDRLERANGMLQLAQASGQVLGPVLGGALLGRVGLLPILIIDVTTFVVSLAALWIAGPASDGEPHDKMLHQPLLREMAIGAMHMVRMPGLTALLAFITVANLCAALGYAVFTPMVLAFTSAQGLGMMLSLGGVGMVAGSVLVLARPGGARRVRAIIVALAALGLSMAFAAARPSVLPVALASFVMYVTIPIAMANDLAIWQTRSPAELQGRLLATRNMVITAATPLGFALAAPATRWSWLSGLADGRGPPWIAALVGQGPGRGLALLFAALGLMVVVAAVIAALSPRIRALDSPVIVPEP